jgi:uncharacterized membrane protein (UPF0127 family)
MFTKSSAGMLRVSGFCLLALALGCAANPGCRKEAGAPPEAILKNAQGQPVRVRVEVATSPREREQGLMHRRRLDPDAGMLFVYSFESEQIFWMKNTYIPLDLFFIGNNRRIVGIVENAKPLSIERILVDTPSRFILEVNAGFKKKHKIREGSPVRFLGIEVEEQP